MSAALVAAAAAAAIVTAVSVMAFAQMPALLIWAAFIGWASYDHSGANAQAFARSSAGLIFGVVMAWAVVTVSVSGIMPSGTLTTAACAAVASFVIVMASRRPMLSLVPAAFYGFASTFAYVSLSPGMFTAAAMTELSLRNPLAAVSISLLIGSGLGVVHGWLGHVLAAGSAAPPARKAIRLDGSRPDGRDQAAAAGI